jgi:hypothetical protein
VQRSSHSIGLPPASRTWTEGKAVSSWAGSHADDRDHDPSRSLEWSSLAEQQCTYPGDQAPCCTFQRRTASLGRGPHVLGPALGPALARVDTPSLVDTRADRLEEEEEEEARRAAPPLSAAGRFVPEGQAGASVIAGGGGHRACCCGDGISGIAPVATGGALQTTGNSLRRAVQHAAASRQCMAHEGLGWVREPPGSLLARSWQQGSLLYCMIIQ